MVEVCGKVFRNWSSCILKISSSGVVVFLSCLVVYFIPSYKKTLLNEKNEWWLKGKLGQYLGKNLLHLLLKLASLSPSNHDKLMKMEAQVMKDHLMKIEKPQKGTACFIGSSTFTYWTKLKENMLSSGVKVPCYNAAFGGSCTRHIQENIHELCISWKPSVVVIFCLTNDITMECSCKSAEENIKNIFQEIHNKLPSTRIVYLASSITPFVIWRGGSYASKMQKMNVTISEHIGKLDYVEFVDSANFQNNDKLYLGDAHHLNTEGHMELAKHLEPFVSRAIDAAMSTRK